MHNIVGETGDEFFMQKYRVQEDSKDYLVIYGFIWAPIYFIAIYDLEQMITNSEYEPEQYWEKDFIDYELNVCFGMNIKTFKTYIEDKRIQKLNAKQDLLNQRWLSLDNNFIRYVLSEYEIDHKIKNHILDLQTCPKITCHGGNSGNEFLENAECIIVKKFNGNIIDFFASMVTICDNYNRFAENGIHLQEVNLIFMIEEILIIHIVIPMNKLDGKDTYWFPKSCKDIDKNYIKIV